MSMKKDIHDLMVHALDNELTAEDASRLEQALSESVELRNEQQQLLRMRQMFATTQPEPSAVFVDNIIARLAKPKQPRLEVLIIKMLPQIAAACILAFAVSLSAIYLSEGTLSLDAVIGVEELSLDDAHTWVEY